MSRDPVCGMEIDPKTSSWSMKYNGSSYSFCCEGCLNDFMTDPESYLDMIMSGDSCNSCGSCGKGGCSSCQ